MSVAGLNPEIVAAVTAVGGDDLLDPKAIVASFLDDRLMYLSDRAETLLDLLVERHCNMTIDRMPVFAGALGEKIRSELPSEGDIEVSPEGHGVSLPVAYSVKKLETPYGRVSICRLWDDFYR